MKISKMVSSLNYIVVTTICCFLLFTSCSEEEMVLEEEIVLKADIGCGEANNGYAYCTTSSSDPDGDGWGWEQNQSCVVYNSQADPGGNYTCGGSGGGSGTCNGYSYCSSSSVDPDGDGWGWENNQSCIVSGSGADTCAGDDSDGGSDEGSLSGSCPSSISCPTGMSCGCYQVAGLGASKQDYNSVGADRRFLASAMMETEGMNTNYAYGDNKTGDAFNAGACKQNWGMIKTCQPNRFSDTDAAWNGMSSSSLSTRQADVDVYNASRDYYGSDWFAGHRNGASGLQNPNTQDINNFKAGYDWTYNQLVGHESDDIRFWVDIPAI